MINNIIDHSEAGTLDITIKKDCLKTCIVLEDNGVGIWNKIKSFFCLPDDQDAVIELSKGKLTTDKANHSGEGIFFTSRILDSFFIVSGNTCYSCNEFDEDWFAAERNGDKKGTKMIMTLSNQSQKDIKEIFDRFAPLDEGFVKTSIPIKNIFPVGPISRSQAKRLCRRLDEFETVELDFNNVEWMGQGFADQLFRVYINSNTVTKIIPINMNESVRKMYVHVTKK